MSSYYTSDKHWQENECPNCNGDFDISPIPRPDTLVTCPHCGTQWKAGENNPNTYFNLMDDAVLVGYPESESELK